MFCFVLFYFYFIFIFVLCCFLFCISFSFLLIFVLFSFLFTIFVLFCIDFILSSSTALCNTLLYCSLSRCIVLRYNRMIASYFLCSTLYFTFYCTTLDSHFSFFMHEKMFINRDVKNLYNLHIAAIKHNVSKEKKRKEKKRNQRKWKPTKHNLLLI